jgi:glycolate oxidase iron-sulfur subunit
METRFTLDQLADPDMRECEKILRACVHCGFCTATCPTYVLLGDELDSPRGRIYLLKEMLEQNRPATAEVVTHIDRCLSCLSCMTTCPSGVNYMHLVDHGRRHIERTYTRPWRERMLRRFLSWALPHPSRFRGVLRLVGLVRSFRWLMPANLRTLVDRVPVQAAHASPVDRPQVFPAQGPRRKRVALLSGCVQPVLAPRINEATVHLLQRHGCEVVIAEGAGCCGAVTHHLGQDASAQVRRNIDAWLSLADGQGLDAIVVNASGCGTMVKDYGFLLRDDPAYAAKARQVTDLARDITELLGEVGLQASSSTAAVGRRVIYQNPCSMQHGQNLKTLPKALLAQAGFVVLESPEEHMCCGAAGTYNLLQPEIAAQLGDRKARRLSGTAPDIVVSGNMGCMMQLAPRLDVPIVHMVELLDWATGGEVPQAFVGMSIT